jgi:hypothetical protein
MKGHNALVVTYVTKKVHTLNMPYLEIDSLLQSDEFFVFIVKRILIIYVKIKICLGTSKIF